MEGKLRSLNRVYQTVFLLQIENKIHSYEVIARDAVASFPDTHVLVCDESWKCESLGTYKDRRMIN